MTLCEERNYKIGQISRIFIGLLLTTIIISCETFSNGFRKLNRFGVKTPTQIISFSRRKPNLILSSTCFYDEDNDEEYNYVFDSNLNNYIREGEIIVRSNGHMYNNDPLYTLVWFDCVDCKRLLLDVKKERKDLLYINGSYYFYDENDESSNPLLYKNAELIATDVFSIYEELFYNKMN